MGSEPSPATYDHTRLDGVCNGNEDLRKRILEEYVQTSPALLDEMLRHLASGDAAEARRYAHGLKGSSRTIGAIALADLCERVERDEADPGSGEDIRTEFDRLRTAIERHVGLLY